MLAVINHEVDVASSNNNDMDLFRRNFPREADQLRVIGSAAADHAGVGVAAGVIVPFRAGQ